MRGCGAEGFEAKVNPLREPEWHPAPTDEKTERTDRPNHWLSAPSPRDFFLLDHCDVGVRRLYVDFFFFFFCFFF